jgi:uncharacterized protein
MERESVLRHKRIAAQASSANQDFLAHYYRSVRACARSFVAIGAFSVVLYMLPQLAGGVVLLMVAAAVLGTVFAAQRLRTGRLTEPLLTHAVWSIAIFVVMPLASV